jgi:glycosyltransferase involved in cell wall biosynthesis
MSDTPVCSVIIPTYNRHEVLRRCLDALAAQTVPAGSFEVIIADDGSTDGTEAMVATWAAGATLPVRYFHQRNAGANAARNAAIRLANAPILLIINDDTIAVPGLLAAHLVMHGAYPGEAVCVLGRMTISPELRPSLFAALHHDASFRQFAGRTELGWDAFFTCNLSVKRDFLLRHGLFDEALRWHEDIELGERLVRHGLRLLYCPEALGLHHHFLGESEYLSIAAREGRALALWHLKRRAAGQPDNSVTGPALRPALRHRLADLALTRQTVPVALAVARYMAPRRPALARAVYAKIFQKLKRQAVNETLRERSAAH